MIWFVFRYPAFRQTLKRKYGVEHLHALRVTDWHHGCGYFSARYKGRKIFIKSDYGLGLLPNEVTAQEILRKYPEISRRILPPLFYDAENFHFVAYEYIEAPTLKAVLNERRVSAEMLSSICQQLTCILDALYKARIVYRDFKLDNIFVFNSSLILIDFMFAISPDPNIGLKEVKSNRFLRTLILRNMGGASQKESLLWDDAFGLHRLMKEMNYTLDGEFGDHCRKIAERVGRLEYSLN